MGVVLNFKKYTLPLILESNNVTIMIIGFLSLPPLPFPHGAWDDLCSFCVFFSYKFCCYSCCCYYRLVASLVVKAFGEMHKHVWLEYAWARRVPFMQAWGNWGNLRPWMHCCLLDFLAAYQRKDVCI